MGGGQDNVGALKRVLVRPPQPSDHLFWRGYGWRAEPDPARAAAEHEALRAELELAGCEVVVGTTPLEGDPDAIFAYDPALVTDRGAILLRPGKPAGAASRRRSAATSRTPALRSRDASTSPRRPRAATCSGSTSRH